jgi:hypothetical protein
MKYAKLYYLAVFAILFVFIFYSFKSFYREGLINNIDSSIINSNVQNGALSNDGLLNVLNNLASQLSSININKINVVATQDGKPVVPMGSRLPNNVTTVSLNGRQIGTVSSVMTDIMNMINAMTSDAQSIDINYTTLPSK